MKKLVQAVILIAAVVSTISSAQAQQTNGRNRLPVELTDPNRPATIDARNFQGSIEIRVHAARNVIIAADDDDDVFGTDSRAQGLRRLTAARLSIDQNNNVVTIRNDRADGPDLRIFVPARTNLKLQSMNDAIDVHGVEGEIEVECQNDEINLVNVAGSVSAHSRNDDVTVTMARITPDKPMAFTSANGDVDVTLPANTRATLRLNTVNGDIYTDFDVQIQDGNGNVAQRRERSISGTINGGGPVFDLRSINGNVYIRRGR